jgi:hypothetical protein
MSIAYRKGLKLVLHDIPLRNIRQQLFSLHFTRGQDNLLPPSSKIYGRSVASSVYPAYHKFVNTNHLPSTTSEEPWLADKCNMFELKLQHLSS